MLRFNLTLFFVAWFAFHALSLRPPGADVNRLEDSLSELLVFETDTLVIETINGFGPVNNVFEHNSFTILEDTFIDFCASTNFPQDQIELNPSSSAAQGEINELSNLCFQYTPNPNYFGYDVLQVILCSPTQCDTAVIVVHVIPVNDSPVGNTDFASCDDRTPILLNVLANDYDVDGSAVAISGVLDEGHGEIVINESGELIYFPELGFCGVDVVTYTIADTGSNNSFGQAMVYITVTPADTDHDLIPDYFEGIVSDVDDDGFFNHEDSDSDNDGIPDQVEAAFVAMDLCAVEVADSDSDGLADYLDGDSDNDGILDMIEAGAMPWSPIDSDNDGRADYVDVDSDNDGISDFLEQNIDSDGDGTPNYLDLDSDNDGLLDSIENPYLNILVDTDNDSVPDFLDIDSNNDGVLDEHEGIAESDLFDTELALTIPEGFSPNGDGVADTWEIKNLIDHYPNAEIEIFNRWGSRIYSAAPFSSGWRGNSTSSNVGDLPSGTYFFKVELNHGEASPIHGFVYLSR